MRLLISIILFLGTTAPIWAQAPDSVSVEQINKRGLRKAVIGATAVYGVSMAGLNHLWYRHADKQSFRFFNDNAEWKQMDKIGHFYSSFYLSYGISKGLQHYNVPVRKADLAGAIAGFAVLLPIEIFDGYSTAYGASPGDLIANALGPLFYLSQKSIWNEVRIHPKFSFHTTAYSAMRPEILGRGGERIIKDYNGQTYWLSFDMDKFITFPSWLNIAIGYGAEGMVYARDEQHGPAGLQEPYRQYYLSVDFDLSAIRTRSKAVKTLLFFASMVKIPAPALVFSRKGTQFYPIYF